MSRAQVEKIDTDRNLDWAGHQVEMLRLRMEAANGWKVNQGQGGQAAGAPSGGQPAEPPGMPVGMPGEPPQGGMMPGGPMGMGGTVAVRSPRGQVVQVPQDKLQEALANGGQRV